MLSLLPTEFLAWCLFGLGALALGGLGLCTGRWGKSILLGLAALLLTGAGITWTVADPWVWPPVLGLGGIALGLALLRAGLVERTVSFFLTTLRLSSVQAALLLVGGGGVLGWQLLALNAGTDELTGLTLDLEQALDLQPHPSLSAVTDAGNPIPLFTAGLMAGESLNAHEMDLLHIQGLERHVIQTADQTLDYNCHGWVFGAGRCWVRSMHVKQILTDNHYQVVARAVPGDVAVFCDSTGEVRHTGLVKAVAPDGMVLLESKWGMRGRYLHTPQQHAYRHCTCTYYHSDRPGHALRGLDESLPQGDKVRH